MLSIVQVCFALGTLRAKSYRFSTDEHGCQRPSCGTGLFDNGAVF